MAKNLPAMQETWFDSWVGKIPWRRAWQPTAVFLPGESHGQRSLESYSPWGRQELDTTEQGYDPCKIGPAHVPGSNVPGLTGRSHLGPQSPPLPSASLMLRLGVGCHLLQHFRLVFFSLYNCNENEKSRVPEFPSKVGK